MNIVQSHQATKRHSNILERSNTPLQRRDSMNSIKQASQDSIALHFEALYRREYDAILRFYCRHGITAEQAEDLLQESFLKAWKAFASMHNQSDGAIKGWLYRVAYNCMVDYLRKPYVCRTRCLPEDEEILFRYIAYSEMEEHIVLAVDVERCIARVPERTGVIIRMLMDDMPYITIAERCKVQPDSAKSLVKRARQVMVKAYAQEVARCSK